MSAGWSTTTAAADVEEKFYRIDLSMRYRGDAYSIDYVAGCNIRTATYLDGDRGLAGSSLTPYLFSRVMPDGGMITVVTPNMCLTERDLRSAYGIDPLPILIHFEDADHPYAGLGYAAAEAFASPISVITDYRPSITPITYEEFEAHVRTQNNDLDYQSIGIGKDGVRLNANEMPFRHPLECGLAVASRVGNKNEAPDSDGLVLNNEGIWSNGNYSSFISQNLQKYGILGVNSILGESKIYPVDLADSKFSWSKKTSYFISPHTPATYEMNALITNELNGFVFCNTDDQSFSDSQFSNIKYSSVLAIDGVGPYTTSEYPSRYGAFVGNRFYVRAYRIQLYNMGGTL